MHVRFAALSVGVLALAACAEPGTAPSSTGSPLAATSTGSRSIGINVLLTSKATPSMLAKLGTLGAVTDQIPQINALSMRISADQLASVRALSFVAAASPDAERDGAPVDAVAATGFSGGISTWDQDAINVIGGSKLPGRNVAYDGTGVYVGVLDTGLLDSWRQYFPQERIASQYAIAFGGGGGEVGSVSSQPNKWEHDQNSHGTHVTSTILGYQLGANQINGTAPKATVIPVKVLNQNGKGWSSVIAHGITYIADLKAGPLAGHPVVINMSLGGSVLDPVEKAAVDYAVRKGVLIVAAAGNTGTKGMHYPGAYAPVISVAASGWVGEWATAGSWWATAGVAEPTKASDFYITEFSSRAKKDQDLDVAAPGSWVVGPYQENSGQTSYFYLGGTSMASPHVAGIVALMAQKKPSLVQSEAESILESTAITLDAGCRDVPPGPGAKPEKICWDSDATGAGLATADAALAQTN
jgi:subtilisin family serine protease